LQRDAELSLTSLAGSSFKYNSVRAARAQIEKVAWLPELGEQRVRADLIVTSIENCHADTLDVVFSVYSTQVAAIPSLTWEARQTEKISPQTTAGVDQSTSRIRVAPRIAYDRSDGAQFGTGLSFVPARRASAFVDSLGATGLLSNDAHTVSAAAAGEREYATGWLASARWDLHYQSIATSASDATLRDDDGGVTVAVTTRPIGGISPIRVGASLDGGSASRSATVDVSERDARYSALKMFAGTSVRTTRNLFEGSFGIELGSTRGARVDWTKAVVDLTDELSLPLTDHHSLDIESRFALGTLSANATLPAGTRFIGGSRERLFASSADWEVRGSPVVRGIPANDFTLNGAGADRFVSYNLTLSYPFFVRPLVPSELSRDKEFGERLQGALATAASTLQQINVTEDPHFKGAIAIVGTMLPALVGLKAEVVRVQATLPDPPPAPFRTCSSAVNAATRTVTSVVQGDISLSQAFVVELLPETVDPNGEDRLNRIGAVCTRGADPPLASPAASGSLAALHAGVVKLVAEFRLIDTTKAARAAEEELAPARTTLHTLLYDANLISIGPVAMFDVARLSGAEGTLTGVGIGGGVRAILASSVSFTVGYVANPRRHSGQPAGALQFSMQLRDLFE
jgi:hypothetical protein